MQHIIVALQDRSGSKGAIARSAAAGVDMLEESPLCAEAGLRDLNIGRYGCTTRVC